MSEISPAPTSAYLSLEAADDPFELPFIEGGPETLDEIVQALRDTIAAGESCHVVVHLRIETDTD